MPKPTGRQTAKTLPITIGKDKAYIFYGLAALAVYAWIIGWVAARVMLMWTLLYAADRHRYRC